MFEIRKDFYAFKTANPFTKDIRQNIEIFFSINGNKYE